MTSPEWLATCLVYCLALWVLLSGLDDLCLQLVCGYLRWSRRARVKLPPESELQQVRPRRMAVFVPLWHEHGVIRGMLEHNLAALRYQNYDFFAGAYPNDPETSAAVAEVARRFPNVHLAMCPHDGPTSKADCLNWIYQRMLLWEEEHGQRFEAVVIHDAEDLVHPESLRLINRYLLENDMVQVPVLPLPTPFREWTHGLYCDEFAEFQSKDIPVRQFLGGFIASNGVGTGFSRGALEALAREHANRIFEPSCLTEDYEAGYRIHALGRPQVFVPIHVAGGSLAATREYFPRNFGAAVKQRTRWVTGISLQSWERHGWKVPAGQLYWFWRDRKGLVGNLLGPPLNMLFVWGVASWLSGAEASWMARLRDAPGLAPICAFTLAISVLHLAVRAACVRRIYGAAFAAGVPLRAVFGNVLNCISTALALWRYFSAKLRGEPLVWLKTDHTYPSRAVLMPHKRRLGEILTSAGWVSGQDLERALAAREPGERLGEYLVRTGYLSEQQLYRALSIQQSLPLGKPAGVTRRATRALPRAVARKWRVLPFQVLAGKLWVAGPELPSDEMTDELQRYSSLELRYHLVTPTEFSRLAEEYLR